MNQSPLSTAAQNSGKIEKTLSEFKAGTLKSSSGQTVTNPKQGIAIAISEARRAAGK